ncbi:MAG TPA: hypothetical protein VMW36_00645, partial [Patescibacteria group bacterium]|nr:hypothetical protein [Patescibacteria group bacterium]
MTERETPSSYFKREELRGLFVLGLLAVVASIRIQNNEIIIVVEQKSYNLALYLDVMLFLWSLYAFFMVLGLSEDIIDKKSSIMFREISTWYLYVSFIILGFLSIVLYFSWYPTRAPWVLGFLPVLFVYWLVRKIVKVRSQPKLSYQDVWKRLRKNLYQLLLAVFIVCLLLIVYGASESFIIPSFIVGSASLIGFLMAREKIKE